MKHTLTPKLKPFEYTTEEGDVYTSQWKYSAYTYLEWKAVGVRHRGETHFIKILSNNTGRYTFIEAELKYSKKDIEQRKQYEELFV